jgi:GT2 family glycosyltransferase
MRTEEMRFLLEMMPYAVAIVAIVMFFLYLTLRTMFASGKRADKKKDRKSNKPETLDDRLEEVIRRAGDLQHRISNLEDIVHQDHRSK